MTSSTQGELVGEFGKNSMTRVLVRRQNYRGQPRVDVREWAVPLAEDGDLTPTKRGINLRPDQVPRLIEALEAAITDGHEDDEA